MRTARYYLFMKWFKKNHLELYNRYFLHINIPASDLRISISIDYIQPEHKKQIPKIINEYNENNLE